MFDLKLLIVNESNLVLGTPRKGRIILFGIASFLGWMMFDNAMVSFAPGLLVLIAVIAGFYTEKWLFDLERQLVVHTEGLLFFNRKKSYPFQEVVRMELRNSSSKVNASRSDFGPETLSYSAAPSSLYAESNHDLDHMNHINRNRGKGFSGLFLIFNDGKEVNVHTTSIKKAEEQAALGRSISLFFHKPFSV